MLRVVLMEGENVMQAILSGHASVVKTFLGDQNQQLNSVCFDAKTHEVTFPAVTAGAHIAPEVSVLLDTVCRLACHQLKWWPQLVGATKSVEHCATLSMFLVCIWSSSRMYKLWEVSCILAVDAIVLTRLEMGRIVA